MYFQRHLEAKLLEMVRCFKLVLITGARQVGKSTLLTHLFPEYKLVVFDPVQDLYGAKADPDLFLAHFKGPLILDEIQYVPELIAALKRRVDLQETKGQYILTGSQHFAVMRSIAESLAGRVAVLELGGFTPFENEFSPKDHWLKAYLTDPDTCLSMVQAQEESVYDRLWRGTLPDVQFLPSTIVPTYFASYMQTYVERDVRMMQQIGDLSLFSRFVTLVAALTGQELNFSQIGRELGVSPATAHQWLDLLTHSFQYKQVWPFEANTIKRISKKRKGYFSDTGFACYLLRITSAQALAAHPLLGALFESYCVSMIYSLIHSLSAAPAVYHWRTSGGAEVNLVLELDNCLFPIEMKCKSNVKKSDCRGIKQFFETYSHKKIVKGVILYAGHTPYAIDEHIYAIPYHAFSQ